MTDEELVAAAVEVFRHYDDREAADERAQRRREWARSLFCWDGILPLTVLVVPELVVLLLPGRQHLLEITFIIVPVVAFIARYINGMKRFQSREMYWWQMGLFLVGIFDLFALDALLVMAAIVQGPIPTTYWMVCLTVYGIYLFFISVALFPFRVAPTRAGGGAKPQAEL